MIIFSGGQTGVDRAAWDAAIESGLEQNGFVPKGRLAEDGKIPLKYNCTELESDDYAERTKKNLLIADATLILSFGKLTGGTLLTYELCLGFKRPMIHIDLDSVEEDEGKRLVLEFLEKQRPKTLNIAGPRASSRKDVYNKAKRYLKTIFQTCNTYTSHRTSF